LNRTKQSLCRERLSSIHSPVIPAEAGIQQIKKASALAGQHHGLVRFAGCFFYWIPAFAGMTLVYATVVIPGHAPVICSLACRLRHNFPGRVV
jgi:hypothetical protein